VIGRAVARDHWPTLGRQRDDVVPRPVERRPQQLGHARVKHDLPAAAIARMEHARNQPAGACDEVAAGLDRQARRSAVGGDRVEERRQLAREPLGRRGRDTGRRDREAATHVQRVEVRNRPAQQCQQRQRPPHGVPPGVDRAEL
jgi:hypothetical protein